ncbi:hypothetical protein Fot_29593 [Forsythia ovata]|uniref:Uncharacterized protein n=1 Tax=Forsythia ovata TaxID=205694 RepID=A0ABD1TSB1_9LAMI
MKKSQKSENESDIEILKAVAQAWHGHSSSSKTATSEFDARRLNFKNKPTRFKLEAMGMNSRRDCVKSWDFGQSLWDSYEIVTVSKRLETGLMLENPFSALDEQKSAVKRRKESSNSLRNLFNKMSSRRFNEDDVPD